VWTLALLIAGFTVARAYAQVKVKPSGTTAKPQGSAPSPSRAGELFQQSKIWSVHLKLTPDAWTAMEPTGGPPLPGAPFGPPPMPMAPAGPPPVFGPAMFLSPMFLQQGDQDRDGKLSAAEFRALGPKWFASWDRQQRGTVTPDQLRDGINAAAPSPGGPGGFGGPILAGGARRRNGIVGALGIEFKWVQGDVEFEGHSIGKVGVRYKGNGTFLESRPTLKRSLKIDFNRFVKGQKLAGVTSLNLHNNVADPSWMNDVLSYQLFRDAGVPAPRTSYARVYVTVPGKFDRQYLGLYELVEDVDKHFLEENLGTKDGALLKPSTPRPFTFMGDDWRAYEQPYEPKDDLTPAQRTRILDFCRLVSGASDAQFAATVGDYLDLEKFARFMAVTVWLTDLDSILAVGQNYYVYLNPRTDKLEFIPWDKDHSFGQFPPVGGQDDREQLSIHRPWMGENPFLERVFKVPAFKTLYLARLTEFGRTLFLPERFAKQVDALAPVLRPAIEQESREKRARFEQTISGEVIPPAFPPPGAPRPGGAPGGGPNAGRPGPGGPGFGGPGGPPPGFFQPTKPIKPFVKVRAQSVLAQLSGKSAGRTLLRPLFPGPGDFMAPFFMAVLDVDRNGQLTRKEALEGFARWMQAWDKDKGGVVTRDELDAGINSALPPFGTRPAP